jgi:hypothetical protein
MMNGCLTENVFTCPVLSMTAVPGDIKHIDVCRVF